MTYPKAVASIEHPADLAELFAPEKDTSGSLQGTRAVLFDDFDRAMKVVDPKGYWLAGNSPKMLLHRGNGGVCGMIEGRAGLSLARALSKSDQADLLAGALFVSLFSARSNFG